MKITAIHHSDTTISHKQRLKFSTLCAFVDLVVITALSLVINDVTATNSTSNYSLPVDVTIVTLEQADGHHTSLPRSLPMMDMVIEHTQQLYAGRINFNLVSAPGSCNRSLVGVAAASIKCNHNISVFIGPTCSKAAEIVGYMAADWNVPVLTNGNTGNIGDKSLFPTLTRVSHKNQGSFVDTFFFLLDQYQWTRFVMIYDDSDVGGLLSLTFRTYIQGASKYTMWETKLSQEDDTVESIQTKLADAATRARVFLVVVHHNPIDMNIVLWRAAYASGYATSGEFAWLQVYFPLNRPSPTNLWGGYPEDAQMLKKTLAQWVFFYIYDADLKIPPAVEEELVNRSLADYGYDYNGEEPAKQLIGYWNSVLMYALVLNETLSEGGDPYDGRALTAKMWNRSFQGLIQTLFINSNGDRNSEVTVDAMIPGSGGQFKTYAIKHPPDQEVTFLNGDFPWPYNGGTPPLDEPVCGYLGNKCAADSTTDTALIKGVSIFFGLAVCVASIIVYLLFRRWKKQSEKGLWWWLIEPIDLKPTDRRATSVLSMTSKMDNASSKFDVGSMNPVDGSLAVYKGQIVRTKKMNIKQPRLDQEMLNDFKTMREISHNNLTRLFGASVETDTISLVTEHCPKGTLQDLLGNVFISLDAQFKFSLCTDIISGLAYLHSSAIKCHGRLNSEVCCVDNRFTVKLAGFGLPTIYTWVAQHSASSQEYKTGSLWRAPEHLRSCDARGSKEGDIYSFGIILSEVISRESPYSDETTYMTIEEILEKLRVPSPNQSPFRPVVEVPAKLSDMKKLMERCWSEDPKLRPLVNTVKAEIKRIVTSLGETGNLLDNLLRRMEQYANNLEKLVEEKTVELRDEKKRSEELLYQILPRPVADRLKAGLRVEPEQFDCVTIYFSDIVGFTVISASSTAIQIVDLLNDLYSYFDAIVEEFDVYKVETIGDAYMVVSGLPQRNGNLHAVNIARMSLKLLCVISSFKIRHKPDEKIKLRIGLHSGAVCAGVVGLKMPRYCLFGDTVNTASRMESHGEALKIHMSEDCKTILDESGAFTTISRGENEIKGKGLMTTYWLTGEHANRSTVYTTK